MKKYFCCIIILILSLTLSASSYQIEVRDTSIIFYSTEKDSCLIKCIDSSSVLFVSINDFFNSLQVPIFTNDTTGKIECIFNTQLVRFTAQNPFIVFTDKSSSVASIYQMPTNVIKRQGSFFMPLTTFTSIFQKIKNQQLIFESDQMRLRLATARANIYDISDIKIEEKINGYLITIMANRKLGDYECWLKPDGWLFLTIIGATADTVALNSIPPFGALKKVMAIQSPTSLQLTFNVSTDVIQAETITDQYSNNLLISLRTITEKERKELKLKQQATKNDLEEKRNRWKMDVIVIDPGHGGKDPGTIGVRGTKEKNVTLAVALKLGKLIEKHMKDVKVVYTRKTDDFVELYRRTQIANEAGGKLFISIHCNSTPRKPSDANGFEIYLLRPSLTEEAIAIASRENAVIQLEEGYQDRYRKLTEEEFILINMTQSAYMKYSEQFAEIATHSMARNLYLKNGGVKQAGFYVLVGASMPNVLVELGYLSNKNEEKYLASEEGQEQLAMALYKSIREYKYIYEKTLEMETYN